MTRATRPSLPPHDDATVSRLLGRERSAASLGATWARRVTHARGSRQVVHVGRGPAPCARVGRVARRVRGRARPPA
eukprot:5017350-Prymnesium_polylepis.1